MGCFWSSTLPGVSGDDERMSRSGGHSRGKSLVCPGSRRQPAARGGSACGIGQRTACRQAQSTGRAIEMEIPLKLDGARLGDVAIQDHSRREALLAWLPEVEEMGRLHKLYQ